MFVAEIPSTGDFVDILLDTLYAPKNAAVCDDTRVREISNLNSGIASAAKKFAKRWRIDGKKLFGIECRACSCCVIQHNKTSYIFFYIFFYGSMTRNSTNCAIWQSVPTLRSRARIAAAAVQRWSVGTLISSHTVRGCCISLPDGCSVVKVHCLRGFTLKK